MKVLGRTGLIGGKAVAVKKRNLKLRAKIQLSKANFGGSEYCQLPAFSLALIQNGAFASICFIQPPCATLPSQETQNIVLFLLKLLSFVSFL
ncbi:hypothetical protein PEX1_048540 [Penicillium expansum]|uniref:Uncharacterized protein n=1 Tax=Penicillium expansum TaxID=27334 RepID=A0A0A2K835_PENEN|nr:hypothetical protein PEX2_043220 [Penicillium expansum]KGO43909.1 hypothetical protein PEXP_092390 [Penicillium expansum]KGO50940.1 hypothetical protein PEX1_048540 [Penicillium expansum]KGO63021.1 hypothetical protein PEX2_043220 [Penicillium expansum]